MSRKFAVFQLLPKKQQLKLFKKVFQNNIYRVLINYNTKNKFNRYL